MELITYTIYAIYHLSIDCSSMVYQKCIKMQSAFNVLRFTFTVFYMSRNTHSSNKYIIWHNNILTIL